MYDAIIVGARCAGAPTAMLLARKGYRVLLVDRDEFPSDILSTHFIHLPGIARLKRWGLLDKVVATGVPWIPRGTMHFNGMEFQPPPPPNLPEDMEAQTICPRRVVLDKILIDAAVEAGAEFREGFPVRELIWDGDTVVGLRGGRGQTVEERARIVIGADGLHSVVARAVRPQEYETVPTLTFGYYTYWTGIGDDGMHIYFFDDARGILTFPTHWGQTCIGVGGEISGFHEFRGDILANYMAVLDRVPQLAERVRAGKQEEPFRGTADQPNYFRKPFGPGWALVGDAGYHRDFLTGLGITDAFRDAELLAIAADEGFSGRRPLDEAMAGYQRWRDDFAMPLYRVTTKMAAGEMIDMMEFMQFGIAIARMIPPVEETIAGKEAA